MSEIPFVNRLGDELESAAERERHRPLRTRRRRRLGLFAVAGALLVSGTALATGLLSGDVEHQATAAVACYDGADSDFSGSVAAVPQEAGSASLSPIELCRHVLGLSRRKVPPLVACAKGGGVAVIPGRNRSACADAGFVPLDRAYGAARARAARLERQILAIETTADCIPRRELARRVQQLLDSSGWTGWTADPRGGMGRGPCGSVSYLGGDGRRYFAGSLDAAERRVLVSGVAPRRITDLLYSAERSLLGPLFAESGARCFTFEGFRERAREVFAAKGLSVTVKRVTMPREATLANEDGRSTRYKQGCAVLASGGPGRHADSVAIEVFLKP